MRGEPLVLDERWRRELPPGYTRGVLRYGVRCCRRETRLASDKPPQLQPKPFQPRGRIAERRDLLARLRQLAGRQQMMVLAVRAINWNQA